MFRRMVLIVTGGLLLAAVGLTSVAWGIDPAASDITGAQPSKKPLAVPYWQQSAKQATEAPQPAPAPKSIAPPGTQPYALDFTMPTMGKSGCMVCHGDVNLIRIRGDQYVSYYVPDGVVEASAHGPGKATGQAGVLCTGCHADFASTQPHAQNSNWQRTAKSACRACHTLEDNAYSKGAHSIDNRPGVADPKADLKPLCGDCHGGHEIRKLDEAGQQALRAQGWSVCGRCHPDEWANYADYYHGAAYEKGAPDAPACWDCHGSHQILPSSDKQSPTNPANLIATCSGETAGKQCHSGVNDEFVSYSGLIHKRAAALQENWLYALIKKTQTGISDTLSNIADTVRSWFG